MNPNLPDADEAARWRAALALALGAAVSLGLARFSYAVLLPPMRADLGWNYTTAGAMNTLNALGYLLGALAMPRLLARFGARAALVGGSVLAAATLACHGVVASEGPLYALRLATGAASAATFVAGGV
ncbi:MAG: YbfB/YjiJ family MFS transporter, partial [Rubrivivax sp.]